LPEEPLQIDQLGGMVAERRAKDGLNLREAADIAGVSFNTLSRVERGHTPDLSSFRKIVDWLGLPADRFFTPARRRAESTPDIVEQQLLADPALPEDSARKIAGIVADLYRVLARRDNQLAVHLRAAPTFQPPAGDLLAGILDDMQAALIADEDSGRAPRV
jgi:transcriptional regulator with XRE-family HTH domain